MFNFHVQVVHKSVELVGEYNKTLQQPLGCMLSWLQAPPKLSIHELSHLNATVILPH